MGTWTGRPATTVRADVVLVMVGTSVSAMVRAVMMSVTVRAAIASLTGLTWHW